MNKRQGNALAHVFLGACVGYALHAHVMMPIVPFDDAYILFRYVRQFFDGHGLVYNPGQYVFGVSTPLMLLWLLGLQWLQNLFGAAQDFPTTVVRMNVVFFIATGLATYLVMLRAGVAPWLSAVATGLLLVNQRLIAISGGGMESFLYTSLALFALLAAALSRPILFGLIASLAVMTRLEGVFLVVTWLIAFWPIRRKLLLAAIVGTLPIVGWFSFAYGYYGMILPHSVVAKSQPIYLLPTLATAKDLILRSGRYVTGYSTGTGGISLSIGVVALALFVIVSFVVAQRRRDMRVVAFGTLGLYLGTCAMYAKANIYLFDWYTPGLQVIFMVVHRGLWCLAVGPAGAYPLRRPALMIVGGLLAWFAVSALPLVRPSEGASHLSNMDWIGAGGVVALPFIVKRRCG